MVAARVGATLEDGVTDLCRARPVGAAEGVPREVSVAFSLAGAGAVAAVGRGTLALQRVSCFCFERLPGLPGPSVPLPRGAVRVT